MMMHKILTITVGFGVVLLALVGYILTVGVQVTESISIPGGILFACMVGFGFGMGWRYLANKFPYNF